MPTSIAHRVQAMTGRDPHEHHRTATPLELLYDLTFVVAFGIAGNEAAHLVAEGHWRSSLIAFGFAMFAVCWAWIQNTWFASAYDTDDWVYRLLMMVQMIGVLVLALGLPPMFESIDHGAHVDNAVMVLGYIIMRIALVALWLRAAVQDPPRRRCSLIYAGTLLVAQLGWIVLLLANTSVGVMLAIAGALILVEVSGPIIAEQRFGGTPWHPHHIAERYGLLTIITLGEVILGTVAALDAVLRVEGWTVQTALVGLAGVGLALGMWWMYFVIPYGDLLERHRNRSFGWGYGHLLLFASLAATGAGLHVAALALGDEAHLSTLAVVASVAVPLSVYVLSLYGLYSLLTRQLDPFHAWLIAGTAVCVGVSLTLAAADAPLAASLLILTLAPAVTVVGYELLGHRHIADVIARSAAQAELDPTSA